MKKLVAFLGLGGVILAVSLTFLALCCMFASIAAGPMGSHYADGLTALAGSLFALSRIGVIAAIVGGGLYAGFFVDWAALQGEPPKEKSPEAGPIIDVTPQRQEHNSLD